MTVRIGIDTGGTFTDVVCYDAETGDVSVTKTPSTPPEFDRGVLTGIEKILGETAEENQWVEETRKSLRRMEAFMNDPSLRKRARELVRNGHNFRALWAPWDGAEERIESAVERARREAEKEAAESDD